MYSPSPSDSVSVHSGDWVSRTSACPGGDELKKTGVDLELVVDPKCLALNRSGSSVGLGGLIALKLISGGSLFTLVCLDPFLRGGRDGY